MKEGVEKKGPSVEGEIGERPWIGDTEMQDKVQCNKQKGVYQFL